MFVARAGLALDILGEFEEYKKAKAALKDRARKLREETFKDILTKEVWDSGNDVQFVLMGRVVRLDTGETIDRCDIQQMDEVSEKGASV